MTNTNPNTGIRYGTIYMHHLDSELADQLMFGSQATNLSEDEAYKELKKEVERDADEIETEIYNEVEDRTPHLVRDDNYMSDAYEHAFTRLGYADRDDYVDTRLERESQGIQIDEPNIAGEYEGVKYEISWLGGAPLLWVFESPIISKAKLCSPCVPGAISLEDLDPDGYEGYGIPDDWRIQD